MRLLRCGLDSPCPIPPPPMEQPYRGRRGELRAPSVNGAPLPLEWGPNKGRGSAWKLTTLKGHGGSLVEEEKNQLG